MNEIAEEILSYYGISDEDNDDDSIEHYGMPRRSGRYPWGSGKDPYQHAMDFLGRVEEKRKQGFTFTDEDGKTYTGDTAIAKSMKLSTTQFRTELSLANEERRMYMVARAKSLKSDGKGATEIGRELGIPESTVRSLLDKNSESRMKKARETAKYIEKQIKEKGMIDVTSGTERELGISSEKMRQALYLLEREGYPIYSGRFEQATNWGNWTTQKVICPKGTKHSEIYKLDKIHALNEDNYISRDGGDSFEKKFNYPSSLDSKRLKIRYNEEGGIDKDGIIELRRGVADLSLGESRYSQVRIMVDGTHYLKGMAIYSDNMPDGVDVIFNTNKKKGTPMTDVLKKIKDDPDNPFGSLIKDADQGGQYWYDSKTGERISGSSDNPNKKLGLINKRADEGDWSEWKDALPSQFLSKQNLSLINKQLKEAKLDKQAEFDSIMEINNPTIKKHFLNKFADSCDAAAVNLQAAALPGQKYHVIIPINTLKDNEIYAPQYDNGTKLALVRYPHGGTFEIPILTVNNRNPLGAKVIGKDTRDAVGINKNNADRLSGADFDGDTVMCIPATDSSGNIKIKSKRYLDGLKGFDPKVEYGSDVKVDADGKKHYYDYNGIEFKPMSKKSTGIQMGIISNLITDMTLAGAEDDELAAAVRHSMVVIDAEKHKLNYKQSEIDNNIAALHEKYQGKRSGGAYTIISKAKGQRDVLKRQGSPYVNMKGDERYDPTRPEGALIYKTSQDAYEPKSRYNKATKERTLTTESGEKITYRVDDKEASSKYDPIRVVDKDTGKVRFTNKKGDIEYAIHERTQKSTKMAETDDPYTLVSKARNPKELAYADYASTMKAMANKARIEMMNSGKVKYDRSAKDKYRQEYDSLMSKLNDALLNSPRERAAQRKAQAEITAKRKANPNMETEDLKKASQQALSRYRNEVGSIKRRDREIEISDREWEAIQAGAISENKLKQILDNSNPDKLRERATPKTANSLSKSKINRINSLAKSGYTLAEIARKLGVSTSTVSNYLKGEK